MRIEEFGNRMKAQVKTPTPNALRQGPSHLDSVRSLELHLRQT